MIDKSVMFIYCLSFNNLTNKKEARMRKNIPSVLVIFVLLASIFSAISVFAQDANATRKDAYDAIAKAKENMAIMEKEGFGVVKVNDLIIEASSLYEAQVALEEKMGSADFSNIVKKANEAETIKTEAYEINDELDALESQLNEASKEQDMKEAINIFNRAKKEFADERYDKAKEAINDCYDKIIELQATFTKVKAVYEASTASIVGFFSTNYVTLTIIAAFLIVGYFLFGKKIRRYFINKSIRKLELEKETLNELVRKSQDEYFTKKSLAESTYRIRITKFAELIRDINRRLPLLKVKLEKLEERKERRVKKEDVERIVSREVEGIKEEPEKRKRERKEGIMFRIAHSLGMAKTAEEKKEAERRKKVIEEKKKEVKKQIKPAKEAKAEEKKPAKKKSWHKFWVSIGFARTAEQKAAAEKRKKEKELAKKRKEDDKKRKVEDEKRKKLEEKAREESKKRAIELVKKRAEEEKRRKIDEEKRRIGLEKKKTELEKAKPAKEEKKKKSHSNFWVSLGLKRTPEQKAADEKRKREKEIARKRAEEDKRRKQEEERKAKESKKKAEEEKKKKEQEAKAEKEKKEEIVVKKKPHANFWVSIGFARTAEQKARINADKARKKREEETRKKSMEDDKKRKIEAEKRKRLDEIKRKELEKQKAESERKRKIEDAKRQEIQRKQAIENAKKRKIEDEKKRKFEEIKRKELEKAKAKEAKERVIMFARKRKEEQKALAKEKRKKAWLNFWHSLGLKRTAEEKARIKAEKERIKKEKELQKKIREQIKLAKKAKKQELTQ